MRIPSFLRSTAAAECRRLSLPGKRRLRRPFAASSSSSGDNQLQRLCFSSSPTTTRSFCSPNLNASSSTQFLNVVTPIRRTTPGHQTYRFLSSFVPTKPSTNKNDEDGGSGANAKSGKPIVLFRRNPDFMMLRTGVGFSSFHTAYWLWYVTDFIPLVNASPMGDLHIDPTLGYAGLSFAIAIQAVFFVYPTRLVSKLEYQYSASNKQPQLRIYTHTIPIARPATKPTVVPVGRIVLDPAADDTQTLLDEYGGDLQHFQGRIGIGPPTGSATKLWSLFPYLSYLMEVRQPSNVPDPDLLLDVLLYPEEFTAQQRQRSAFGGDAASHHGHHRHPAHSRKHTSAKRSGGPTTAQRLRTRNSRQRRESQLQKILKKRR